MAKNTYRLPKKYLSLNIADMLFWDAVYFLMETEGKTSHLSATQSEHYIEIKTKTIAKLTGLSNRSVQNRLNENTLPQDNPRYNLRQESGATKKIFFLVISNYEELVATKAIQKPTALFKQDWFKCLSRFPNNSTPTRIPIALLNQFLKSLPGSDLTFGELQHRIKNHNRDKPPDSVFVHQGLTFMKDMGLLQQVGDDSYCLNRARLNQPAQPIYDALCAKTPLSVTEHPAITDAKSIDLARAEKALALAKLGNFDLAVHFEEIFRDLQYIFDDHQMGLLENKVRTHRNKPLDEARWYNCWEQFQRDVRDKSHPLKSSKITLSFKKKLQQNATLQLPAIDPKSIAWAKIVFWLKIPDYSGFTLESPIHTKLFLGKTLLWEKQITENDEITRYDLTRVFRNVTAHICDLTLVVASPLPRVSLKTQLEARVFNPHPKDTK